MQVIPVIDLLNGQVVHAQQGKRDSYSAIQSSLVPSAKPHAVIDAMLDYYPFQTIYIADLNSIQQKVIEPQHYALINALCKQYPSVTFWVDAGASNNIDFEKWAQLAIKPILGTENFTCFDDYARITRQADVLEIVSLDFINSIFMGDQQILSQSALWPETVIAMTLDYVGANNGPNWETLREIKSLNQHSNIVAAGGVRHLDDLYELKAMGVNYALIATALHQKRLSPQEIAAIQK